MYGSYLSAYHSLTSKRHAKVYKRESSFKHMQIRGKVIFRLKIGVNFLKPEKDGTIVVGNQQLNDPALRALHADVLGWNTPHT